MVINTNDKKSSAAVLPEMLYMQHEVDEILEKREYGLPTRAKQIEEEGQTANKRKRLENKTVAGLVKKSNRILISISSHAFPMTIQRKSLSLNSNN